MLGNRGTMISKVSFALKYHPEGGKGKTTNSLRPDCLASGQMSSSHTGPPRGSPVSSLPTTWSTNKYLKFIYTCIYCLFPTPEQKPHRSRNFILFIAACHKSPGKKIFIDYVKKKKKWINFKVKSSNQSRWVSRCLRRQTYWKLKWLKSKAIWGWG